MGVKMNLSIVMKKHVADPEIGFLTKSILLPYGRATAIPLTWKLSNQWKSKGAYGQNLVPCDFWTKGNEQLFLLWYSSNELVFFEIS